MFRKFGVIPRERSDRGNLNNPSVTFGDSSPARGASNPSVGYADSSPARGAWENRPYKGNDGGRRKHSNIILRLRSFMKLAITGKGGVGKTTLSSTLARLYADEGRTVLAADVDPDANLGLALGLSQEEVDQIVPISKMKALAKERTGASDDNKFYKLNPYVADIPETYAKTVNGVKLLVMGTVDVGGTGCVCPEHVMLKSILSALTYRKNDVVIMDMEAGLEHLGRGTAQGMDQFIVVIEPGARSVQTYRNVKRLALDLGIKRVRVVANKVRDEADEAFVKANIPAEDLLGCIHYNPDIIDADRQGKSPYDFSPEAIAEIRKIKEILDQDET